MRDLGNNIRVGQLSPGVVETEFAENMQKKLRQKNSTNLWIV